MPEKLTLLRQLLAIDEQDARARKKAGLEPKEVIQTQHSAAPFVVQQQGPDEPIYVLSADNRFICRMDEGTMADAKLFAASPKLLKALLGLLAQATGPAGVWGDGRGNDGRKTGLSGEEFNALRDERIKQARAAIAEATT